MRLSSAYEQALAQLGGDAPQSIEDDSSDGEEAAMNAAFVPSVFQQYALLVAVIAVHIGIAFTDWVQWF